MKKTGTYFKVISLVLFFCFSACSSKTSPVSTYDDINTTIQKLVAAIKSLNVITGTPEDMARANIADAIRNLSSGIKSKKVTARTIDDMTSLLKDNNIIIRAEIAVALGDIGAPAQSSLPALRTALKEENAKEMKAEAEHTFNGYDVQCTMRNAISKISGNGKLCSPENYNSSIQTGWP